MVTDVGDQKVCWWHFSAFWWRFNRSPTSLYACNVSDSLHMPHSDISDLTCHQHLKLKIDKFDLQHPSTTMVLPCYHSGLYTFDHTFMISIASVNLFNLAYPFVYRILYMRIKLNCKNLKIPYVCSAGLKAPVFVTPGWSIFRAWFHSTQFSPWAVKFGTVDSFYLSKWNVKNICQ